MKFFRYQINIFIISQIWLPNKPRFISEFNALTTFLHVPYYTKNNVTFYLPRPLHFLSYQSNRLLRRSDLHRKNNSDSGIVLMTFYFLKPKTISVDLTAKF
jgi:hypothetical protein